MTIEEMRQKSAEARKMALDLRRQLQGITDAEERKQLSRQMNDLFAEAKELMDKVKFQDPAVDERLMRKGNGNNAAVTKVQDDRDVAFYYPDQVPTDNKTYITQNVAGVGDLSVYREITAEQLLNAETDTKVRLIGRPIQTVIKDKEMLFWDQANKPFRVIMNGAFIPLGQRSFVYGTLINNGGVPRMSLEMVESIE